LEKIDIYLVKNELKRILIGKKEDIDIETAILPATRDALSKLKDADKENLSEVLKSYGFEKELIDVISEEKPDLLKIDVIVDNYIINKFRSIKVPYKCEQAKQSFIKSIVDISNIKNILRAKKLDYDVETCKKLFVGAGKEIALWKFNEMAELDQVPQVISALEGFSYFNVLKDTIDQYNRENSVQILENALDGYLLKLVKDISLQNYLNLGPTIRFLVSKEFEIKNLKAIAKGIGERLSPDIIKNFLIMETS
jgi:vacuolar-type H+-ATPase subunit C/Vma6